MYHRDVALCDRLYPLLLVVLDDEDIDRMDDVIAVSYVIVAISLTCTSLVLSLYKMPCLAYKLKVSYKVLKLFDVCIISTEVRFNCEFL